MSLRLNLRHTSASKTPFLARGAGIPIRSLYVRFSPSVRNSHPYGLLYVRFTLWENVGGCFSATGIMYTTVKFRRRFNPEMVRDQCGLSACWQPQTLTQSHYPTRPFACNQRGTSLQGAIRRVKIPHPRHVRDRVSLFPPTLSPAAVGRVQYSSSP